MGPAAMYLDCGIRGQEVRLSLVQNTTVSHEAIAQQSTDSLRRLMVSTDLSMSHIRCAMAFHMQIHDWYDNEDVRNRPV